MNTLILLLKEYLIANAAGVFNVEVKYDIGLLELVRSDDAKLSADINGYREFRRRNKHIEDRRFETIWIEMRDGNVNVMGMWSPLPSKDFSPADPQLCEHVLQGVLDHFQVVDAFLRSQDLE